MKDWPIRASQIKQETTEALKQWKQPRTIHWNPQKLNRFGRCGFTQEDLFYSNHQKSTQ
jgi:hypothetical protein